MTPSQAASSGGSLGPIIDGGVHDTVIPLEKLHHLSAQQAPGSRVSSEYPKSISNSSVYGDSSVLNNKKVFRVLDLKASEHIDDPLEGSLRLEFFDQEDRPLYNAVSYVWGPWAEPPDAVRIVQSSGVPCDIAVTRNCRDCLRRLRDPRETRTIWVDSICIDQASQLEKAHQIPLIGEIYTWADRVYIWLGSESEAVSRAVEHMMSLEKFTLLPPNRNHGYGENDLWNFFIFTCRLLFPVNIFYMFLKKHRAALARRRECSAAEDFLAFLRHEWFTRSWTFQEVVLGLNPIMLTSKDSLRWEAVIRAFSCLRDELIRPTRESKPHQESGLAQGSGSTRDSASIQESMRVIHYDAWDETNSTSLNKPTSSSSPIKIISAPMSLEDSSRLYLVEVFDRLVHLWKRAGRPASWATKSREDLNRSFDDYQTPYLRAAKILNPYIVRYIYIAIPLFSLLGARIRGFLAAGISDLIFVPGVFLFLLMPIPIYFCCFRKRARYEWSTIMHDIKNPHIETTTQVLMDGFMHTLRMRKATEPKDKAYAIHGVLENLGYKVTPMNHGNSRGKTYHTVLRDLLECDPSALTLLLDAGESQNPDADDDDMTECPSWVPNWHCIPERPTIRAEYFMNGKPLDATRGSDTKFEFDETKARIQVQGTFNGYVSMCTPRIDTIDMSDVDSAALSTLTSAVESFHHFIMAMEANQNPSTPTGLWYYQSRFNARPVTVEGDPGLRETTYHRRPFSISPETIGPLELFLLTRQQVSVYEEDGDLKKMKTLYGILRHDGSAAAHAPEQDPHQIQGQEQHTPSKSSVADIVEALLREQMALDLFISIVNDMAKNERRLFITSDGYRGCGSKDMKVGDRFALVAGVPAPFVLRPVDGGQGRDWYETEYTVSCSAFVLGWMDGSQFREDKFKGITLV